MEVLKLYVVTHKEVDLIPIGRTLVGVGGKEIKNVDFYDNTGDNIAGRNANYCELTALYWMWKNSDSEFLGLEHYRRFFCTKNIFKAVPLKPKSISDILLRYDIILPKQVKIRPNVYDNYKKEHFASDLDLCGKVINDNYPEYAEAYKTVMNSSRASMFNMFVTSKKIIDEYSEWLFGILFKVEQTLDISDRDAYQKRVYGFLSERLFNVWLYKKNLNAYYARVYGLNEIPWLRKVKGLFRRIKALFKRK